MECVAAKGVVLIHAKIVGGNLGAVQIKCVLRSLAPDSDIRAVDGAVNVDGGITLGYHAVGSDDTVMNIQRGILGKGDLAALQSENGCTHVVLHRAVLHGERLIGVDHKGVAGVGGQRLASQIQRQILVDVDAGVIRCIPQQGDGLALLGGSDSLSQSGVQSAVRRLGCGSALRQSNHSAVLILNTAVGDILAHIIGKGAAGDGDRARLALFDRLGVVCRAVVVVDGDLAVDLTAVNVDLGRAGIAGVVFDHHGVIGGGGAVAVVMPGIGLLPDLRILDLHTVGIPAGLTGGCDHRAVLNGNVALARLQADAARAFNRTGNVVSTRRGQIHGVALAGGHLGGFPQRNGGGGLHIHAVGADGIGGTDGTADVGNFLGSAAEDRQAVAVGAGDRHLIIDDDTGSSFTT